MIFKKTLAAALFVLLFITTGCYGGKNVVFHTRSGDYTILIETADTEAERERGLMYRDKLDEGHGMLFIFKEEAPRNFWMKNTLIPLDIIFIDGAGKIINIAENAQPCKADPCEIYKSVSPAMYVIEIGGGESSKHNIMPGDYIEIPFTPASFM